MIKKKVLFVIDSLSCGGAEKSLVSLLPLLDYSKMEVDLMMISRGGVFEQYIPSTVQIVPYNEASKLKRILTRILYSIALRFVHQQNLHEVYWQSKSWAIESCEKSYDVAIAYGQGLPTYFVADKVDAFRKIFWINNDLSHIGMSECYNRNFYDKAERIVAVSDSLYNMLCKSQYVDKNKLIVVYDILNAELIRSMSKEETVVVNDSDAWKICTVGRLVPQKGYDLAIESAKILRERGLKFVWFFVGEGVERMRLEEMAISNGVSDNVVFVGMKPNPYPYMLSSDLYVQTSRFEGFGLTLNEARILGKPCVSTNFSVVYDQIVDGRNGLIAEMTSKSISEHIMMLINDTNLRKKIEAQVRKEVNNTALTESKKVNNLILQW